MTHLNEEEVRGLFDKFLEAKFALDEARRRQKEHDSKVPPFDYAYYDIEKFNEHNNAVTHHQEISDNLHQAADELIKPFSDIQLELTRLLPFGIWFVHGEWCFRHDFYLSGRNRIECIPTEEISHELANIKKENDND